ncbi:hypothetical protein TNIN_24051 [Trichonephila inaurata madagascariensis]|uniref:Uncharacterized protein n=1 Tax=Trichonephila inaurata madagascariensis TaxID=2747483 RepID=A0A8X7CID6_9ARAC|nr:hypothetical protein TNIN_24051 [Trichonephila inaurata madagascariensis]
MILIEDFFFSIAPSSLSKRATEWESDSGHMSDVLPRGSQTLKRPQPRRHHTVGFETGSMTSLPRPSLDLEVHLTFVAAVGVSEKYEVNSKRTIPLNKGSWNFLNVIWEGFTQELESFYSDSSEHKNLEELLSDFTGHIQKAAKHHAPRGKRKFNWIPFLKAILVNS